MGHPPVQFDDPSRAASEGAEPEIGDINDARTAPLVPSELLQPGEIVILMLKPSPLYIVLAPLRSLVIILLLGLLAWRFTDISALNFNRQDVVVVTAGLVILRLFWQMLDWICRVYVLTDRRVIRVMGVVRVDVFETSLKQIQHTTCTFCLRERLFGLGTITFATAGTAFPEAHWLMLHRPLEVHQTIIRTLQRYR